jgi:hypothetical protein
MRYRATINGPVLMTDEEEAAFNAEVGAAASPVPQSIHPLHGLLVIAEYNLAEDYEAWATDPARTFEEKAFINKAFTWKRNDPVLLAGAQVLGLNDAQLDAMFIAAKAKELQG